MVKERINQEYFVATNGAYIQPKLDGIRCIAFLSKGEVVLFTRGTSNANKQLVFLKKQREDIKRFLKSRPETVLDGEMYVHGANISEGEAPPKGRYIPPGNDCFNFISSCCKTNLKRPNENEGLIEYHVFDIVDSKMPQSERFNVLKGMFSKFQKGLVKPVALKVATNELDVFESHDEFVQEGYEGIMLRNANMVYDGKRSLHLLKYKQFEDDEFVIVGADCAQGTKEGSVIWRCVVNVVHEDSEEQEEFNCEMSGYSLEDTRKMYDNYADYLGKKLNVRYQGMSENGVPRFPKGKYFRDE